MCSASVEGSGEPQSSGDGAAAALEASVAQRLRAAGSVFAEDEARILVAAAPTSAVLHSMVERRRSGVPVEHIVGWAEFCGMRIAVDPGVFVPRRRTELLVWQAAAVTARDSVVVDMCCGSGAVGAAVASAVGRVELYAVDIDPAAVRCAQRNIEAAGGFAYEGDLFDPLPATLHGRVGVVVANAPYVPTDEMAMLPPEARDHEPHVALDGGSDGLVVVRRIIAAAPAWLAPGGWVLVETSEQQAPATLEALDAAGFDAHVEFDREIEGVVARGRLESG